jgi:hypothetical protein
MAFVQNDDVIEALPAYGADQAFDIGILPGRARGGEYLFDTEAAHTATKPDVSESRRAQDAKRDVPVALSPCARRRPLRPGTPRSGATASARRAPDGRDAALRHDPYANMA